MHSGQGTKSWSVLLAVGACFAAFLHVAASAAGAATWTSQQLTVNDAWRLPLFGISCPSDSLCVAVGGSNTIASSTDPEGGPWKVVYPGEGPSEPNQKQIRGVSCPSLDLCVAVSFEGLIYTSTDPDGNADAWQVADLAEEGPNIHLYGVSCPTPSFCAASAGAAKLVTTTNPAGGAGAWRTTQLEGPLELRGISCASAALCVAVGDDGDTIRPAIGDEARVLSSSNPLGGQWNEAALPGRQNLFGVSCPATDLCVSGDTLGNLLVTSNPDGGTPAWRQIDGGGSVQITDVDCVSASLCLAVDNNGDILSSINPGGSSTDWTFTNVAPFPGVGGTEANALFGASCASRDFCAVAANGGKIFTSSDPFAATPAAPDHPAGTNGPKRKVKRPRTALAATPPPGVELHRGRKTTIRYRFFAPGHVQVRGFLCKLDSRPLKRCRSPKAYRVGLGRHRFRVRAIGWSGLRGPVTTHQFRVCHPTRYGNCIRDIPGPSA